MRYFTISDISIRQIYLSIGEYPKVEQNVDVQQVVLSVTYSQCLTLNAVGSIGWVHSQAQAKLFQSLDYKGAVGRAHQAANRKSHATAKNTCASHSDI